MPIYDYNCVNSKCENFKKIIEVSHSIKENKPKCEICETTFEVVHSKPPTTVYNGKWFKNSGSY